MDIKIMVAAALCLALVLAGCAQPCQAAEEEGSQPTASSGVAPAGREGEWGVVGHDVVEQIADFFDELKERVDDELEDRESSEPVHAAIGDEVEATENLAVSVLFVEPGPYDFADDSPTMKVTVAMRNLTGKTLMVKASNWDADTIDGRRVDHKLYIKDEQGNRNVRSFGLTKVSPDSTFTGEVYFDGEGLKSVVYEPHWLVSSENQYIYFDI